MLPKVVGAIKLFARVALAELVRVLKVADAVLPVQVRNLPGVPPRSREFVPAVPARVGLARLGRAVVERALVARQRRARPAVSSDVERVLVSLGFVLVLESVAAKLALVLLLGLVNPSIVSSAPWPPSEGTYLSSS